MAESDTADTIVLVGQNLFFLGRVETLAESQGVEVLSAPNEAAFRRHLARQRPALVLVDLEGDASVWESAVKEVAADKGSTRVVAFGPHEDLATMDRARELGCDLALSKGAFNRDLGKIVGGLGEG